MEDVDAFVASQLLATGDRVDGVVNWSAYVGQGAPRFTLSYGPPPSSPEYAYLLFNLTTSAVIPAFARKIEQFCAEHYPSVIATVGPLALGSVIANPVEVRVSGPNRDRVFALVDTVKEQLASINGSKNINDDWGQQTKKVAVVIDEPRARRSGVTHQDVAMSLQWFGGGPMWESMAIAIIFGLIFATLLTLGVVPVLYALLFRVSFKGFRYQASA